MTEKQNSAMFLDKKQFDIGSLDTFKYYLHDLPKHEAILLHFWNSGLI